MKIVTGACELGMQVGMLLYRVCYWGCLLLLCNTLSGV